MLEYSVGSSTDRDDLYVELSFNRVQWGEICLSEDRNSLSVLIYPNNDDIFEFNYDEFIHLIDRAKKHLLSLQPLS
ncbi:hypothetical protein [Erwinia aphidicola]|uniref:hypothetical protein n=1 Tax=Erwinia aphidicola TaxID=68334 RepID=UPI0016540AB4